VKRQKSKLLICRCTRSDRIVVYGCEIEWTVVVQVCWKATPETVIARWRSVPFANTFSCFRVAYFGNCAQSVSYIRQKTKYGVSTDSEEVL
jgi:hypothetical protein